MNGLAQLRTPLDISGRPKLILPLALALAAISVILITVDTESVDAHGGWHNIRIRTTPVCEAIVAKLAADSATSAIYGSGGTYPRDAGGNLLNPITVGTTLGCTGSGGSVVASDAFLAGLDFDTYANRLDLSNQSITRLTNDDFHGLRLVYADLSGNSLTTLPANVFAPTGGGIRISWLDLSDNSLTSLPAGAFNRAGPPTQATVGTNWQTAINESAIILDDNTGLTDLPDTIFDSWTELRNLSMRDTGITTFNTRWTERLVNLGNTVTGYSKAQIRFDGMPVADYHHEVGGTVTTGSAETFNIPEEFAAEIKARIAAYATATAGVTDNSVITVGTVAEVESSDVSKTFVPPPIVLTYSCGDRTKAVEREILSAVGLVPEGDDLGRGWEHAIGDITFARWDKVECAASTTKDLTSDWRTIESGERSTIPYSATTHSGATATVAKGILFDGANPTLNLRDAAIVDAMGALDPDDFENLFNIDVLWLTNVKIKEIPADTFKHMPNLTSLHIENALLEDDDLGPNSFLQHFKNLKTLRLDGNLLTDFDAGTHLPASVRATLESLHLGYNPIKEIDVGGLDLKDLRIQGTRITELDDSISGQDNLETFWWRNDFLTNEGIGDSNPAGFFAEYPSTLQVSQHTEMLGNPFDSDDDVIEAAAVEAQLDHAARMAAINAADPGNDLVTDRFLGDPCRPSLYTFETLEDWTDGGDLCLTSAHVSDWVSSVDSFNGLQTVRALGLSLTDTQAGSLLDNIDGKPIVTLQIAGAQNAFGTSFSDAKLNAFDSLGDLEHLYINGTDLTLEQATTILTKLSAKYLADGSATAHNGLETLDLSYNPGLFSGASASDVATFLSGVAKARKNQKSDLILNLRETGLTFAVLNGIIDSMDEELQLRGLDVSNNPNLFAGVAPGTAGPFFRRLRGTTNLNINNTGFTGQQAAVMFPRLRGNGGTELGTDAGGGVATTKHTLARINGLHLGGSTIGVINLALFFDDFAGRYDTAQGALHSLSLGDTGIDIAKLNTIATEIDTTGALETVRALYLGKSGDIWKSIDTPGEFTTLTDIFAKFTNLRTLSIRDSSLPDPTPEDDATSASHFTLEHLEAILEGLDQADGDDNDSTDAMYLIDLRDNIELFAPLKDADGEVTETAAQHAARLAPVFAKAEHAIVLSSNTGLTQAQLNAIIGANDDLKDQLREGGAVDMSSTPPPKMAAAQSGRRSLKIVFTHEPRSLTAEGTTITQTGYQYRFRALPDEDNTPWTEPWRTLTLDLSETGEKSFNIHALEPEAAYQIQLRASGGNAPSGMTAASGTVLLRGGTILDLPQINSISPEITEVSIQAGGTVRLSVDIIGLADEQDNDIANAAGSDLIFRWSETSTATGGSFADPNHERRVIYTAPGLPGTYTVMAEAQPDGVCRDHHATDFGITDADRADCQATFTVRVSRAPDTPEPEPAPVNAPGLPATSLTDNAGTAYAVFLPVQGGTFTGEGITVTAQPGAVPDLTHVGVSASAAGAVPAPTPGSRFTLAGMFFDINGVIQNGAAPVTGYTFDDPISACLPLPDAYRGSVAQVVLVERKSDGSLGVLATKIRQSGGGLNVCGEISNLPATVAVAKLGTVPPPPPDPGPDPGDELPDTGATAPANPSWALWALLIGAALLLATTAAITRARRTARRSN